MVGGCNIEGEDESWDFGTGAGFYVDATEDPWKTNYRMYSYVRDEVTLLPGYSGMVGEAEEGMLVDEVFYCYSTELKCKMRFGIYLPPKAETAKCPVLYWLSGK